MSETQDPASTFLLSGTVTIMLLLVSSLCFLVGCSDSGKHQADGPPSTDTPVPHQDGNPTAGEQVYSFETFGNEGFWTDAIRLPAGIAATNFTPVKLLQIGLAVDIDRVDPAIKTELTNELKTDLSPQNAPLLNNVSTTFSLLSSNAVVGLAAKDSNADGIINVATGDKIGMTCALCHTVTDGSTFSMANGGTVGHRLNGRASHVLQFGNLVALGTNSRAFFPALQLTLAANGGKTLGRAPTGLTENSTEAEVDAYLSNPAFYPPGMFDDTVDGNGDPMHNMPLFRQDLAAPFGSGGEISRVDNFSNLVYTALLDPTTLTTAGGRAFLEKLGGKAAGDEISDKYIQVLAATGVTDYPIVQAAPSPLAGTEDAPLGVRVDNTKLLDMNAFLSSIPAPPGVVTDAAAVARGRDQFRTSCTSCHNVDQSKFVPVFIVPMKTIYPGDTPDVLLAQRTPPLNPILNTPDNIFDDKMAVINASLRGLERGTALPLLLDLARKPVFLHDNSVPSLDALLDPVRGPNAPHPFFLPDTKKRADMVEFLRSLDTVPPK